MSSSTARRLAWAAWLLCLLGFAGVLIVDAVTSGPTACELAPGTSIYGEASASLMGTSCSWDVTLEGGDTIRVTDGPSPARAGVAGALVLWGASLLAWSTTADAQHRAAPSQAEQPAHLH